jgi:hypothetical protein
MKIVALPSGERVPAFGLGSWNLGDPRNIQAAKDCSPSAVASLANRINVVLKCNFTTLKGGDPMRNHRGNTGRHGSYLGSLLAIG